MVSKKIIPLLLILFFISYGCIKEVDVDTRNEKPILVVEGSVTTDSMPYTVQLSYSGPFNRANKIPDEYFEKDAQVIIADDNGNSTPLQYMDKGIYQTTDPTFIGKVGSSYSITIVLKDGRKYVSVPEKINPPVPVNALHVKFNFYTPSSLSVYADVKDPVDEENYYKWSFYSWMPRETNGVSCGFGCIMFEFCYQKNVDTDFKIFSDAAVNGNEIKDLLMGSSYIYSYGNHYIHIRQHSLTREAYKFLERFKEQQTRTGSTLDPLPSSIKGNIYNSADSNDFALGYFSASSVTNKRVILVPYSITQFLLDITAATFIPDGPKICFDAFSETLIYQPPPADQNPPPPGWENAEEVKVYW